MIKIVKIEWFDAQFMDMGGLSIQEDLIRTKPMKCCIVGHLVLETDDAYFIAKELWENGSFKYVHIIPKKIVDNIEMLEHENKEED